jgi:hypothetical protein
MAMEIDLDNMERTRRFLERADQAGWNWAAFEHPYAGPVDVFEGFVSANDAIAYCEQRNTGLNPFDQDLEDGEYRYIAVNDLRRAVDGTGSLVEGLPPLDQLLLRLAGQGVWLMRNQEPELILSASVFPVAHDRLIEPEKEVDRFIIVAHHHIGHQVYEVGHSTEVLEEFETLEKAEKYFSGLIRQAHDNTDNNDYQLIGLYRGFHYKGDMEGTPENYSGLTLKHAFYQYDPDLKAKAWRIEADHDITQPKNITHFLYAKYDTQNARFKLLDDRLKETRPEEIRISTYHSYFINEKLTIKQLNIMNEQSYDYVRNQLKYLGFGDEIAQPLRQKMEQNLTEFTLEHAKNFGKDETKNVLHFSKGDDLEKDFTFFNRFEMTLKQEGKEDLLQTFFVGKEYNYTLQERYNMLDGRAVYREQPKMEPVEENGVTKMKPTGETYIAWKRLDFKESDGNGNFAPKIMFWNHEKELMQYPIKNIQEKYDRSRLLPALQRGDRVSVTLIRDGQESPAKVVANPRMVRLDFYDANGQKLTVEKVEKQALKQNEKEELTPQQVQQQAIARAAAQKEQPEQKDGVGQVQQGDQQASQKNEAKEAVADEQKADKTQRRKQGVHI